MAAVVLCLWAGQLGCGERRVIVVRAPPAAQDDVHTRDPNAPSGPRAPMMVAGDAASDSSRRQALDTPHFDTRLPRAGDGLSVREAFEQNQAEIVRLSPILNEKNLEVVARFGRNDTPEALRVLTPIRDRMHEARRNIEQLMCRDRPKVPRAREALEQRGIQFRRMLVSSRSVDAYVAAKRVDGEISAARAADLQFVLSKTGQGVMNPSSLGASTINQRVAQALDCFGLVGRPRSPMRIVQPPKPPPPPPPPPLRFFHTCGDPVCSGYRGPVPGVPMCGRETAGSACSRVGARCDLGNGCNMHLVCAVRDPSTRCAR